MTRSDEDKLRGALKAEAVGKALAIGPKVLQEIQERTKDKE
jgi:hypothetical protein